MRFHIGRTEVVIKVGDITQEQVDVIVNAANRQLRGGGGVDGAIHRAGGWSIMKELMTNYSDGCEPGNSVMTNGGDLPCKKVLHTVGPVYHNGKQGEPNTLSNCYSGSLALSYDGCFRSIVFPSISTGVYGYPIQDASKIALTTVFEFRFLKDFDLVEFILFSKEDYQTYIKTLCEIKPEYVTFNLKDIERAFIKTLCEIKPEYVTFNLKDIERAFINDFM